MLSPPIEQRRFRRPHVNAPGGYLFIFCRLALKIPSILTVGINIESEVISYMSGLVLKGRRNVSESQSKIKGGHDALSRIVTHLSTGQMNLLPKEARKHGILTIIRDLVRLPGKLVRHARKWKLLFAKSALKLRWLSHAADCLAASG